MINTTFIEAFGTGFNYPYGLAVISDELFACDRQNDTIQVYDISGTSAVYSRNIGTVQLPESITTDGTDIFVTDLVSHEIKQYTVAGSLVNTFTVGSLVNPNSICFGDDKLFIIFQNTVAITETDGTFISSFGSYGIGLSQLNFPHGIAYNDDTLYICDTYNGAVKKFATNGDYIGRSDIGSVVRPYAITITDGVVAITDAVQDKIIFLDNELKLQSFIGGSGGSVELYNWPAGIIFTATNMYVSDGVNDRIQSYVYSIESDTVYDPSILSNILDLYPTGFVWRLNPESTIYKLHDAFATTFSRGYNALRSLYGAIVPDSERFTLDDIKNAENTYGLYPSPDNTEAERRAAVLQAYSHPAGELARQSIPFINSQFALAGFDVVATRNRFDAPSEIDFNFDEVNFDEYSFDEIIENENRFEVHEPETGWTEICANYLNPDDDANIFDLKYGFNFDEVNFDEQSFNEDDAIDRNTQLRGTFFISADAYPSIATVPLARKDEFRQLIMKLKPAQMVAYLYVNYA